MDGIGTRMKWIGLLRRHKCDPHARLLVSIGGDAPSITMRRIERKLIEREIDSAGYETAVYALEKYRDIYRRGEIVDVRDPADWEPCRGGWKGKKHIERDKNDEQ